MKLKRLYNFSQFYFIKVTSKNSILLDYKSEIDNYMIVNKIKMTDIKNTETYLKSLSGILLTLSGWIFVSFSWFLIFVSNFCRIQVLGRPNIDLKSKNVVWQWFRGKEKNECFGWSTSQATHHGKSQCNTSRCTGKTSLV